MNRDTELSGSLIYVHDPMCSWCWGFAPVWRQIQDRLPDEFTIEYLVGGLAPDTNEPMPVALQQKLQSIWRQIQTEIPGTEFNFAFWQECEPRRSTYHACRAVLTAKMLQPEKEQDMIRAIQHGYYLHARNPSEDATLTDFAAHIGLDVEEFNKQLNGAKIQQQLEQEMQLAARLPINGFPSLVQKKGDQFIPVQINYTDADAVLSQIYAS